MLETQDVVFDESRQAHVMRTLATRPIRLYTQISDTTEDQIEDVMELHRRYTDAVEEMFESVMAVAMERFKETGRVPDTDEISAVFRLYFMKGEDK